jgi:DNA replication protein DnaD
METGPDKDWIRLNRSLMLNELWKKEPFTRGQAWVDLLMMANWKDGIALVKGIKIPVKRGQLCRSMKQLSIRWKWSVGKAKRFLDLCSELEQLSFKTWSKNETENETQKNGITTLITITNYHKYQGDGTDSGTQTERRRNADGNGGRSKEGKK